MEIAFWIAVALVLYTYAGYPGVLALVARVPDPRSSSSWGSPCP
jgi:hypothetical protein